MNAAPGHPDNRPRNAVRLRSRTQDGMTTTVRLATMNDEVTLHVAVTAVSAGTSLPPTRQRNGRPRKPC